MLRAIVGLGVVLQLSRADSDCLEIGGRPCTDLAISVARVELLVTPRFAELAGDLGRFGWIEHTSRSRFVVDTAHFEATKPNALGAFNGRFLGFAYELEHEDWGAWVGVHTFALRDDNLRYLVPSAGLRVGSRATTSASLEARSTGLYAAALNDNLGRSAPPRTVVHDLDVDLQITTNLSPWLRGEMRARYRDAITASGHLRDVFAVVGVELAVPAGHGLRIVPSFIGIGVRRVLDVDPAVVAARTVAPPAVADRPWEVLAWLDFDLGLEQARPR